ncbi:hypothetical protein F4678DRAFT_486861 [Xylaria arbuscula]|nr:hypothetical protein F4678DRAFT_486861 [Xylaria arbuscula]
MSPQVTNKSGTEYNSNISTSAHKAPRPESKPMGNTALALAISRSHRGPATPICVDSTRDRETRTFRELYIAKLVDKPSLSLNTKDVFQFDVLSDRTKAQSTAVSPTPAPMSALKSLSMSSTSSTSCTKVQATETQNSKPATSHESTLPALSPTTTNDITPSHANKQVAPPRIFENFDPPRLNVDKEEFRQDVEEYSLRTLKDSRWAKKEAQEDHHHPEAPKASQRKTGDPQNNYHPRPLPYSRAANTTASDVPKQNPPYVKKEQKFQANKQSWRNGPGHNRKTAQNPRRVEEEETPREPPRVIMDMEEFARDVEKYNLKTLKDSRWA